MNQDCASRPVFHLDRDPWIPALYADGSLRQVSLRGLLLEAHLIRDITPDMAQQKLPLLRLALAALYRIFDSFDPDCLEDESASEEADWAMDEWLEIWNAGRFDPEWVEGYFDTFSDCFDLFDPERPFFQTPGLQYTEAAGRPYDAISEAIADVPKPKKYLMALRARNTLGDISFAEAARWLVYLQAFDCAGIKTPVQGNTRVQKGKVYPPKDSVGTGWLGAIGGVFLKGETLFDTLMLNWVVTDPTGKAPSYFAGAENLPVWERPRHAAGADIWEADAHGFRPGPAALYTWQSRRVRLVPNEAGTGVAGIVSCYGDVPPKPLDYQPFEPMTAWNVKPDLQKKLGLSHAPLMPARHVAGRSLWRGFAALLTLDESGVDRRPGVVRWLELLDGSYRERLTRPLPALSICAQGITYGTQSSVIEEAVDDSFEVAACLRNSKQGVVDEVAEVIAATEGCVRELVRFVRSVDEVAGSRHADSGADSVREQAYAELDDLFRWRLVHMPAGEVARYVDEWKAQTHIRMLELGRSYVDDGAVAQFTQRVSSGPGAVRLTVSEAVRRYRGALNACLGPLSSALVEADAEGSAESLDIEEGR